MNSIWPISEALAKREPYQFGIADRIAHQLEIISKNLNNFTGDYIKSSLP